MKNSIQYLLSMTLVLLLFGTACQNEIDETIESKPEEVFSSDSQVASLIQMTTLKDGSFDNIIDGSSCSSIVLPITIVVNGLELTINSEEDFETVENIIDRFDDDDDLIKYIFPVRILLANHTEIIIENEDDMEGLLEDCIENGDDDDIECIDFKYPVSIAVFDFENQVSDVVTIENDKEMHDFIDDLEDDEIASFNFPLTLILSDGSEFIINENDELEDALENAIDDCDEDDDNDHNEDDVDDSDLVNVLLEGEWIITLFLDDEDETSDFDGYVFTFLETRKVNADKDGLTVEGSWFTNGDDGELELELNFGEDVILEEISDDWDLSEFSSEQISLKDVSGDGSEELLVFERKK